MKNIIRAIFAMLGLAALCACSSDLENNVRKDWSDFDDASGDTLGYDRNSDVKILYVRTRYIKDSETRTIGEALTGEEFDHGYFTMRSDPDSREGLYFFIMTQIGASNISDGVKIELYVDSNKTPKVRQFDFVVPEKRNITREIKIGLTGGDWKDPKEKPNACKIVIKTPAGRTIAEYKSWLWSLDK
ncbi:MAG: hypothetical protein IKO42_02330 [Opitutales bacterium]|nr:hypothetical protein [Opitutales bacterium]